MAESGGYPSPLSIQSVILPDWTLADFLADLWPTSAKWKSVGRSFSPGLAILKLVPVTYHEFPPAAIKSLRGRSMAGIGLHRLEAGPR